MSLKRQELIDTAIHLFSQHGFHATGIDWIADAAKVSKKTMYQHFRSKEELILAALRHQDGLFRNFFMKSVEQISSQPYARLLAVFDVARDWFADESFYGCMFINAVGEYSHGDTAIRRACQDFKAQMADYILKLARDAGVKQPEALAHSLALLLEGAIVTAQVAGDAKAADTAKQAAKVLLDNALLDKPPG